MKAVHILFTICFMLMLIVPMALTNFTSATVSRNENRVLAAPPEISTILNNPASFTKQADNWLADNIGLREDVIDVFETLNKLGSANYYNKGENTFLIGQEGHEYFAGIYGELIPKFQGVPFLDEKQLSLMARRINEIKDFLDDKDIPFIIMLCAGKESVYPEYYPASISRGPEPLQLDIITDYLREHTGVDIFNTRQAMVDQKDNYLLYNKVFDVNHYNEIGAFYSYKELMKHISGYFPQIGQFTKDDITIDYDSEGIPVISLINEPSFSQQDAGFFDDVELDRPFTWENVAFEQSDNTLPSLLLLRDSYAMSDETRLFLARYLPEHFNQTIFIHFRNMMRLEEYVKSYQPDIVVLEISERQLRWAAKVIDLFYQAQ